MSLIYEALSMPKYRVRVGGKEYVADVEEKGSGLLLVRVGDKVLEVSVEGLEAPTPAVTGVEVAERRPPEVAGKVVTTPVPGKVLEVRVRVGDVVKEDTVVAVIESMKMSMEVYAGVSGRVKEVRIRPGDFIDLGQVIAVIE